PPPGLGPPPGRAHPCRRGWRVAPAAAVLALSVVGLGDVAEAFWLPPGFGPNQPNRVVAFGDSITAGVVGSACTNPDCLADAPYPAVLSALLSPRHPGVLVVNAGRGGGTTAGGLARLPGVLADGRPGIV